jgi:hypothetical protein
LITITYDEFTKWKISRIRKIGIFTLVFLVFLLVYSYTAVGDLDILLYQLTDLTILRILCFLGIVVSCVIVVRGNKILNGVGLFAEAKKLEGEVGEACRVFERLLKGEVE